MKIVRGQLKPFGKRTEYITGARKLVSLIKNNKDDVFQFIFLAETDEEKQSLLPNQPVSTSSVSKTIDFGPGEFINSEVIDFQKKFGPIIIGDLRGRVITETPFIAQFNEDGSVEVVFEPTNESLPRQQSVDQLKRVMKMSAKTDIGNRISDMNKQGANLQYIQNPINSGIESYEDFEKHNKKFVPSWNLKHLLNPFSGESKKKK